MSKPKMQKLKLSDSGARGWFMGDFPEALVRTRDFEVCYQVTPAGPHAAHYHKIVTEVQLFIRGRIVINNVEFGPGDVCVIEPGEVSSGNILEEVEVVCIKYPSVPDDKYYV